jgi:hypothetical protein
MTLTPARRSFAVFLSLVTIVLLAACSGIPRSSGVNQGSAVVPIENDAIEFLPAGPMKDGSIEQILRGFIEASSSPVSDYAIARQFLTPTFASQWDATTAVNVDSGLRVVAQTGENTGRLTFTLTAQVGAQGNYAEISPGVSTTFDYSFEQVDGQWRISLAPNGVVMDRFTFDQVYQSHPLYFFDSTNTMLVPDVRFFPAGASASTRITKALLAGPSSWLAANGAVQSAFPEGTALVADTVPVTRGVAKVDLNAAALSADPAVIRRMKQQTSASLQSVANINSVDLLVDGAVLNNSISDSPEDVLPDPIDSRPLVLTAKDFGFWNGTKIEPYGAFANVMIQSQPTAISLGTKTNIAATLTSQGVSLVRNGTDQLVDVRPGLIAPTVDNFGYIWSVPSTEPTKLLAISTDGRIQQVETSWTSADRIISLSLSHDGTQVVALLETGGTYQLVASALVRGEKSVPLKLGPLVTHTLSEGTPVAVAWVDATTIATITITSAGVGLVRAQEIGGQSQELSSITEGTPVSMAGANTVSGLRVLTTQGILLSLRGGTQWQNVLAGVTTLAVQQ